MEEEEEPLSEDPGDGDTGALSGHDPEADATRSTISTLEALFAIAVCVGVDLLEIVFNVADFLVSIADWAVGILFVILFAIKGGWSGRWLKKWIGQHVAEQIPLISIFPIRTAVMVWIIWAWNNEIDIKLQKRVDSTTKWMGKAEEAVGKYLGRFG